MSEELHKLGDVLRTARESRGVDIGRVERDTKIRARYLSALERGSYRDLPDAVYTRGFLRNYAVYLGLDPDYLIDLYRLETAGTTFRTTPVPPRPMKVRRARALVVTPGAILAALLTVAVFAFVGYIGYEFVTFARTPMLRITDPAGNLAGYQHMQYTIVGETEPNSRVTVDGLRENPTVTADASGHFSVTVQLVPGANVIDLVADDPITQRNSAKVSVTITVDLGGSPSPGAPVLVLTTPADAARVAAPLQIAGTAPAGATIAVSGKLVSPGGPGFRIVTLGGQAVPIPAPRAGQTASVSIKAGTDGAFRGSLGLAPGTWDITARIAAVAQSQGGAASAAPGVSAGVTRRITVTGPSALTGSITISGGTSYLLLLQDGQPAPGISGRVLGAGKPIAMSARRTIVLRAGNAGVVSVTINGIKMGLMGTPGDVIEWHVSVGA